MGSALVVLLVLLAVTLTYGLFWNFFNIPKRAHYCRVCVDYWAGRKSTELMANWTRFPVYRWNESWPNCQEPYQWVVDSTGCVRLEVHTAIAGEVQRFTSQMFLPLSMMDDMPNGSIPVDKSHGNRTNFIYEVYWNTSSSLDRSHMSYTFCYNRACFLEIRKNLPQSLIDRRRNLPPPTVIIPFEPPTTPASTMEPYFEPHVLPIIFVVFLGLVFLTLLWKCCSCWCKKRDRYIVV